MYFNIKVESLFYMYNVRIIEFLLKQEQFVNI